MRRISLVVATMFAGAVAAAPVDPIAAACVKHTGAPEASCDCQARLARSMLAASEKTLVVVAIRDGRDAMRARLAKLSAPKRQAFLGKLQQLGDLSRRQCRQN